MWALSAPESASESASPQETHPLLSQLVATPYFRYFKVRLYCECPFWASNAQCHSPDCAVCECPADEVPLAWRGSAQQPQLEVAPPAAECSAPSPAGAGAAAPAGAAGDGGGPDPLPPGVVRAQSAVDRTLEGGGSLGGWRGAGAREGPPERDTWTAEEEASAAAGAAEAPVVVNLLLNGERHTGYAGEVAHRVWAAVYAAPCLRDGAASCGVAPPTGADGGGSGDGGDAPTVGAPAPAPEARAFYRLISGMHASISAHIAGEWLWGGSEWGRNHGEWVRRLGDHPQRQQHLYFTTAVAMRALQRAAPQLRATLGEGDVERPLLDALLSAPALASCGRVFDERSLWAGREGGERMASLRAQFRNVSALMDCVGCEKCRLWGKLQFLGVGTALKLLSSPEPGAPRLERNELIALVNTVHRLAESVVLNTAMARAVAEGALEAEARRQKSHWSAFGL